MRDGLTLKQQRFVDEYITDGNATQAYLRAGYSAKTDVIAASEGFKLLRIPKIETAIATRRLHLATKLEITQERIAREYARLAFSDPRQVMTWGPDGVTLRPSSELTADEAATVAEVSQTVTETGGSVRIKQHDKKGALDSLARHLGMFPTEKGATFVDARQVHLHTDTDKLLAAMTAARKLLAEPEGNA